ncbi:hypothetical protein FJ364_00265 [Candidatus Dependentiae bacterium]|nr:hypothetical protein [Candidatus Dependentiae bacterium]
MKIRHIILLSLCSSFQLFSANKSLSDSDIDEQEYDVLSDDGWENVSWSTEKDNQDSIGEEKKIEITEVGVNAVATLKVSQSLQDMPQQIIQYSSTDLRVPTPLELTVKTIVEQSSFDVKHDEWMDEEAEEATVIDNATLAEQWDKIVASESSPIKYHLEKSETPILEIALNDLIKYRKYVPFFNQLLIDKIQPKKILLQLSNPINKIVLEEILSPYKYLLQSTKIQIGCYITNPHTDQLPLTSLKDLGITLSVLYLELDHGLFKKRWLEQISNDAPHLTSLRFIRCKAIIYLLKELSQTINKISSLKKIDFRSCNVTPELQRELFCSQSINRNLCITVIEDSDEEEPNQTDQKLSEEFPIFKDFHELGKSLGLWS